MGKTVRGLGTTRTAPHVTRWHGVAKTGDAGNPRPVVWQRWRVECAPAGRKGGHEKEFVEGTLMLADAPRLQAPAADEGDGITGPGFF